MKVDSRFTNFNEVNIIRNSTTPSNPVYNSKAYYYYFRALYDRLISRFDITIPDYWNRDFFNWSLFLNGFIIIFDSGKYGIIPQLGALHGVGLYYQPTKANISRRFFFKQDLKIGKDCEIIKLEPDYMGVFDILDFYAKKLAVLDGTINQSMVNSRLAYIFGAKSKAGAEVIKRTIDKITSGEPAVIIDSNIESKKDISLNDEDPFSFVDFKIGSNYITDRLLNDLRTIIVQFDNEIGIPNANTEKKERLISSEVESNSAETVTRYTTWFEQIEKSIERVKKLYPDLDLSIKVREYETPNTGSKEAGKVGKYGNEDNS